MIDSLITKTMKTNNNMNFQGARANKIMRDSNSNSRRATG